MSKRAYSILMPIKDIEGLKNITSNVFSRINRIPVDAVKMGEPS